jgi:hypothetical protein
MKLLKEKNKAVSLYKAIYLTYTCLLTIRASIGNTLDIEALINSSFQLNLILAVPIKESDLIVKALL